MDVWLRLMKWTSTVFLDDKANEMILQGPVRLEQDQPTNYCVGEDFLPRDALLSAVYAVVVCLSVCVCVCVCVCVRHTPVLYQNGWT